MSFYKTQQFILQERKKGLNGQNKTLVRELEQNMFEANKENVKVHKIKVFIKREIREYEKARDEAKTQQSYIVFDAKVSLLYEILEKIKEVE